MDTTEFDSANINYFLAQVGLDAIRENRDPRKVLIRSFVGGSQGEQGSPLLCAFYRIRSDYERRGITLVYEEFTNSIVRNDYHWTCREFFNHLLAADIHLIPTHLHQGMLALGGSDTWNMFDILEEFQRLRHHLGYPCGGFTDDCVGQQNKAKLSKALSKDDLCLPTISVYISEEELLEEDKSKIHQ